MRKLVNLFSGISISFLVLVGCGGRSDNQSNQDMTEPFVDSASLTDKIKEFAPIEIPELASGTGRVSDLIYHLTKVGDWVDSIFWIQSYGNPAELFAQQVDSNHIAFCKLHYGPYDRFRNNEPITPGSRYKAFGANLYPSDITFPEFLQFSDSTKESPFTALRRNKEGNLISIQYADLFKREIDSILYHTRLASLISEQYLLNSYLNEIYTNKNIFFNIKADSIYTFQTVNPIEFYIGSFTEGEDGFLRKKLAITSFLLIRDNSFMTKRVRTQQRFRSLLSYFYKEKQFDEKFISEDRIGIYDALFFKGQLNAGSKMISLYMPPNESSLKVNGSKVLLFKNIMYTKFNKILIPIHNTLNTTGTKIDDSFEMFMLYNLTYELVAASEFYKSSRSIDNQTGTLKEYYNIMYSMRSDISTLKYMEKLYKDELLSQQELYKLYSIYIADVIRNIRFSLSNEQSMALLVELNFILSKGGFSYDIENNSIIVNKNSIMEAIEYLDRETKVLFNHGDDQMAARFVNKYGVLSNPIKEILKKVNSQKIPRDVYFDKN